MLKQADEMTETIGIMQHMYDLMQADGRHDASTWSAKRMKCRRSRDELRDHIADFEDFFRPIRNYFYWEQHCYDIPICLSLRSIFDSLDGVDEVTDKLRRSGSRPRSD